MKSSSTKKVIVLLLLGFSLTNVIMSQNNFSSFFQLLDVSQHRGQSFQAECRFFATREDPNSGSSLIAISMKNGKQLSSSVGELSMEKIIPEKWNTLTLKGVIHKDADTIALGALYSGNAKFLYDDFKVIVKEKGNKTVNIQVENSGFENDDLSPWRFSNTKKSTKITQDITNKFTGAKSLAIDGLTGEAPAFGSSPEGKHIDVNGVQLYYETYGEGTPLLLLHGSLESIYSFSKQIPELSKHYKIIAVDTRGHGRSTTNDSPITYQLYAEDINQLLNKLNIEKCNILGWSDGGNTGLVLAMSHPEKIKKMVIMGANLFNNATSVFSWVNDTLRNQIKELEQKPSGTNKFILRVKRSLLTQPNISPQDLSKISCPVLVLAGEKDIIKEEHTKLIARSIPNSNLIIFPGASHYAPAEIPDKFNKAVEEFFDRD